MDQANERGNIDLSGRMFKCPVGGKVSSFQLVDESFVGNAYAGFAYEVIDYEGIKYSGYFDESFFE